MPLPCNRARFYSRGNCPNSSSMSGVDVWEEFFQDSVSALFLLNGRFHGPPSFPKLLESLSPKLYLSQIYTIMHTASVLSVARIVSPTRMMRLMARTEASTCVAIAAWHRGMSQKSIISHIKVPFALLCNFPHIRLYKLLLIASRIFIPFSYGHSGTRATIWLMCPSHMVALKESQGLIWELPHRMYLIEISNQSSFCRVPSQPFLRERTGSWHVGHHK